MTEQKGKIRKEMNQYENNMGSTLTEALLNYETVRKLPSSQVSRMDAPPESSHVYAISAEWNVRKRQCCAKSNLARWCSPRTPKTMLSP